MNKKVNFISSKFFALLMVFVMLFSYIMPLVPVNAELRVHGEGDDRLNIDINNESGFSIQSVTVNGDTWTDGEDEYHTTDGIYQIVISLNKKGDDIPDIGWGGNWNGYITSTSTNEGDLYTYTLTLNKNGTDQTFLGLNTSVKSPQIDPEPNQEPGDDNQGRREFDGSAYFVWKCNGNICKHKIEGITGGVLVNGRNTYQVNYIKESTIVDGNNRLEISSLDEGDYMWIWSDKADVLNGLNTWEELINYGDSISYDEKRDFMIDPTGAKYGANSISTNGDRNFRATIYDEDNYHSIVFGVSEDDYTYFPSLWDPDFFCSEVDISGTTKESPAYYETYILEPNLKFSAGSKSASGIKSVKALDVNEGAVSISKDGNEYSIRFNSNYYDNVIFEITDNNDDKHYIEIKRIVISTFDNMRDRNTNGTSLQVGVNLLYPASKSYNDYEIIADIEYQDGTRKSVKAKKVQTYQDLYRTGEMVLTDEWDAGKNLKAASYGVEVAENVKSIHFNAIKKGALETDSYGGTFAGSGKGMKFENLEKIIQDWYHSGGEH